MAGFATCAAGPPHDRISRPACLVLRVIPVAVTASPGTQTGGRQAVVGVLLLLPAEQVTNVGRRFEARGLGSVTVRQDTSLVVDAAGRPSRRERGARLPRWRPHPRRVTGCRGSSSSRCGEPGDLPATAGAAIAASTYDLWASFWPKVKGGPFADGSNAATKYVATHRPASLGWGPVGDLGLDVLEGVRRVKSQDGPDLVDEVVLIVYPVLLGRGKRCFSDSADPRELALVTSKATPSGVLISTYRLVRSMRAWTFADASC